ncbi:MAG TPA: DNA polymerase III subunit gamma/tau [Thiobacillaceae bacterium]|nr:DNA polymerase III subunit gamma/tau [Thiobacillaceae bacterium]
MSYLVLARKWRPRAFDQLVGQEHVVRALSNALEQGRLHHAYLFTGTRGVGKTTLARILAKCLNCQAGDKVTATPCGECPACRDIEAGRFVDLIEIDAASYTGIDNMREVIENARYAPTAGRYKVYIIDEVHQLSKHAFNAMLKTLEEPPAHVVFILATTDPQKVPVTVLSRCLQFNLKQMPAQRVAEHLAQVLAAEGVPVEPGALTLLGRAAAGSMRDALSLTDQAISYGAGQIREAETRAMLGVVDQAYLLPLLEALADGNGTRLMTEAQGIAERSLSFEAALQDLAGLLYQMSLAQTVAEAVSEDMPERDRVFALARRLDAETVQLYYQIAILGRRDLDLAPDEYAGFAMTLLRMLAFEPAPGIPGEGRGAGGEGHGESAATPVPVPKSSPATAAPQAQPPAMEAPSSSAPAGNDWVDLVSGLTGGVRQLAGYCELVARDTNELRLRLPEAQKPMLDGFGDKLRAALRERLGERIKVIIELGATSGAAPMEIQSRQRAQRQAEAEAAIRQDAFVQAMQRDTGATVSDIQPL